MSRKNLAFWALVLSVFAGFLMTGALVIYTVENDSGHTGIDPYRLLVVFVPVAIIGLIHLAAVRSPGHHRWLAVSAFTIGLLGVVFLVYLDRSNTLLQYEVWIERGMPER